MNEMLVALFSAYLFNRHRIVTAPTFNSAHVLRLEPPFTVGRAEIDQMLGALRELCDALDRVDCYQLVHHFVGSSATGAPPPRRTYAASARRSLPQVVKPDEDAAGGKFAFVLHYTTRDDIVRSDPSFEAFTDDEFDRWKQWGLSVGPGVVHRVQGIHSEAGSAADGWIIVVPMLPRDMLQLGRGKSLEVLETARQLAAERGATVLGLGGFTSIISRGGQDLCGTDITITNGNTLTSVMTVTAVEEAARKVGLDLRRATVAVIGATGSIGRLVSLLLAARVGAITLIGNHGNPDALKRCHAVADEIRAAAASPPPHITCSVDLASAAQADVVIAATNADTALVSAEHLRAGTLVCDVAQPPNVSADVARHKDVLVFDGGLVQLPQPIPLGPVESLPPGVCWGCLGETILLALEGNAADTSIGPHLTLDHAAHIARLAGRHGLRAAPLQRLGRELNATDFARFSVSLTERNRTQSSLLRA
jgi:predicted amino acid dehydrogenase